MKTFITGLALGWLPIAILAAELPEPVLPNGVGVNIHFVTGREKDLDLIAAGGFKFIRMDFGWESIERKKGEYDWSGYDALTRNLEQRGLRAIYILDYSNPLYEEKVDSQNALKTDIAQRDTASPQHPDSIAAYAAWAAAAAKHFQGRHIIWEIWNEPNGFFWKPKPDAAQYSALAVAAAAAIREAEPEATIIGPALSGFQPGYMEVFLKSSVLKYIDAVSVHPYRAYKSGPETAGPEYGKLREMIARYAQAAGKKALPIISGEWGYSTKVHGVSPETQAAYLVRQQLYNLLSGVTLSIWYDWKNDGTNLDEVEDNFGTVTDKLEPKPAYTAIKVLTHELAGYSIVGRVPSDEHDFILFMTNNTRKLAAWTTGEPHDVKVRLESVPGAMMPGVNGMGDAFTPEIHGDELTIKLEALPKYLKVPIRPFLLNQPPPK